MERERKKVLEMLAEGKITADEAAQLLDRLEGSPSETPGESTEQSGAESPPTGEKRRTGEMPRYLRVVVNSNDGDRVNVRVPLELVRTGIKLSAMLPDHARKHLDQKGIDLSQLSGLERQELIDALRELTVDVDSADGDVVRVFCE